MTAKPCIPRDVFSRPLPEAEKILGFSPDFPCVYCDQPVEALSMGGSAVCPRCDMGRHRDGTKWTYQETLDFFAKGRERMS